MYKHNHGCYATYHHLTCLLKCETVAEIYNEGIHPYYRIPEFL
jgi:hypothetical protein